MIYLDYQATTPPAPEVVEAMKPWLGDHFANPHSPSRGGREAAVAIDCARQQVEGLIGLDEGRAIFTSGATEAINWAMKSLFATSTRRKLVTIATEHAAVLDSAGWLAGQGVEVTTLAVDREGLIDLDAARSAIDGETALVAGMLVNNEIGVIQPVEELGALAHAVGAAMLCDAVQGLGRVALPDNADFIAVSAHKLHGPKGIGALWIRDGRSLEPLIHGGGQQDGMRSGTLSPALCVGFGEAARAASDRIDEDAGHVRDVRDALVEALGDGWILNGSAGERYAGNLNLRRDGLDASRLLSECRDIAFSLGSACASGSGRPSHVLRALGLSDDEARQSIRLGFGRYTSVADAKVAGTRLRSAALTQSDFAR